MNHFCNKSKHILTAILAVLLHVTIFLPLFAAEITPPEIPVTSEDRQHWSFKPLVRPDPPHVRNVLWARNPVDQFILARLEAAELLPMPEVDRLTLIRRVTFDLTGLPPTPQQIEHFFADQSPNAYELLVDRLLASDEYGPRWAQHWLDLARFAETDGFEHDKLRPNAWRYRDWVIDALNNDIPYDQFVRLQIAGDEIDPENPNASIATGFLLSGPDMPDINLQTERRHNFLNDLTGTVGSVFLGLQFGCAQCHDHKYDPISQYDFYRLRAFFDSADIFKDHSLATPQQRQLVQQFEREKNRQINHLKSQIKKLNTNVNSRLLAAKSIQKPLPDDQITKHYFPAEKIQFDQLLKNLKYTVASQPPSLPFGRVIRDQSSTPRPSFLQIKGDFRRQGPSVTAAYPRIVSTDDAPLSSKPPNANSTGLRTQLANWLTSPSNPLSTRVIVNRLWQHHFTRGLSVSESDFGIMGDEPTHPLLLDWLATELPLQSWSMKRLHRLMVTSATYRQASRPNSLGWSADQNSAAKIRWQKNITVDRDNDLLSRMRRRRLEGEAIRDTILLTSGQLSQRRNGPGIRPPLPNELLITLLRNQWPVSPNLEDHNRRSIYLFVRRNLRYPIFELFDKPDTNQSCARRNQSTIAPQALMLFNSEQTLKSARHFAGRILLQSNPATDRIRLGYQLALGRQPTEQELTTWIEFLKEDAQAIHDSGRSANELAVPIPAAEEMSATTAAAYTDFCLALFNLNEFVYID